MSGWVLVLAFMFAMVGFALWHQDWHYVCPSCGSTNGEHHEDCAWKK